MLAVVALDLSRLGRDRQAGLADELNRALVEANHGPLRVGRLGVEIEHVLHAGDAIRVEGGNAPHVLAPRLEFVLGQTPRRRLARQALVGRHLDQRVRQQFQRPAGAARRRARAGGRRQQSFLLAGELAFRSGTRIFAQGEVKAAFDETPPGPVDRRPADPDVRCDVLVADPRIRGQKNLRPLESPRRRLAPLSSAPSSSRSHWVNVTR